MRKILVVLFMLLSVTVFAQKHAIKGTVVDQNGQPVVGMTVMERGTQNGVITDSKGGYQISVANPNATLEFNALGYKTVTEPVSGRHIINVSSSEEALSLDAVVAIGYGSVKKKDLTTAVSVVSTEDIQLRPVTEASSLIQGKVAGVQVIQTSGLPGSGMTVRVRGASSIASSNDPLYVVDGVPVGTGNYAIAYLSPNDIETMQILKDASSAAIYGSRAANGVVLITTKMGSKSKGADIHFSSYVGLNKVTRTYDVLNVAEYKDLMDYIGAGYTDEQGIFKVAYSKRYNVKASVDADVFKWISVGTNLTYSHYKDNGIISGTGSNRAGVVLSIINTPTYAKTWSEDNPNWYWTQFYGANLTTPSENIARTENNFTATDRMVMSAYATIKFYKDLNFKSTVSMDRRWVHDWYFLDPIHTSYGRTQHGEASDSRSDDRRMVYDNIRW